MNIKELEVYLEQRIKDVEQTYETELPIIDMGEGHKVINITGLNKKEREEVINKRNCLLVQKYSYEEVLNKIRGVNNES